jgi:diguanylate cyclase (GGDEF)-like protein/PAS domain S-box-containing protein
MSHLDSERLRTLEGELQGYRRALEQFQASVILLDPDGFITHWGPAAARIFGYAEADAVGQHILFLYSEESAEDAFLFNRFLDNDRLVNVRYRRDGGEDFWARMLLLGQRDDGGRLVGLVLFILDVSAITPSEERERLNARLLDYSRDAVLFLTPDLRVVSVNPAYARMMLGAGSATELDGHKPGFLDDDAADPAFWQAFHATLAEKDGWHGDLQARRGDGQVAPFWLNLSGVRDDGGRLFGYFGVLTDLGQREINVDHQHGLAQFDNLTKLPRRAMFIGQVDRILTLCRRLKANSALLCISLNGLSLFNQNFGYLMTDQLIVEAGKRLRSVLRDADVLGRLDGDKFAICLSDVTNREHAAIVAQKLEEAFGRGFMLGEQAVEVSLSIGISVFPDDGTDAHKLVSGAEIANKRAEKERETWLFCTDSMQQRAADRFHLDAMIRHGLANQEFRLYYQPKVDVRSGRMISAEALIRLRSEGHEHVLGPGVFMPYAEETRHIHPIGAFVIAEACRQLSEWRQRGLPTVRVAVNVSANQLRGGFFDSLMAELKSRELPPELLEVEITESTFMRDESGGLKFIRDLREAGLSVSLDDFGTGYSSLSVLRRMPLNTLKIDRSFVMNLPDSPEDCVILQAILDIAGTLGLETVAEGVETEAQAEYLRSQGCHVHQGFLYAKPLPAEAFEAWLRALE